jgi:RsiW-degrading membrane proteinase PrsW (M82 family)
MSQNYGVLRVVRVRPPANATTDIQERYPSGWLPEEQLVHLITRSETSIGRALDNDIILMDPTASREHARLILDALGWHVVNLTMHNVVRVNGQPVPSGASAPLKSQDVLVLGSTMLQLIAPQHITLSSGADTQETQHLSSTPSELSPVRITGQKHVPHTNSEQGNQNGHGRFPNFSLLQRVPFSPLPVQPEPEEIAQPWNDEDEENALGAGITMQFALPQRMGTRTRWVIAGIGFAILMVSAIITIVLNSVVGLSSLALNGPSSILAALTIPVIPALGIGLLVNFIDRYEREPWFLRLAAFLWGAVIAIPPTFFIELNVQALIQNALGRDPNNLLRSILLGLNAGVTEETVKGLGLLLLFFVLRDEFDNVTDGIVYGSLIGAGFAMVENFSYFAQNSKDFLLFLIVGRIVLGWLSHSTFTVCFGVALGYVRHTRVRWRHFVIPLLGYLAAVALHSVFDFVDIYANAMVIASPNNPTVTFFSLVAVIGDYIPPFVAQIVLLYFLIKSLAHEVAVIREFLAPEVSSGVVKVDEYAILQNSFQRTRQERRVLMQYGVKQWMRVQTLYQTEIGLAFRKWHVSMGDKPKLGFRQPEDAYRKRIKRLRYEIMTAAAAKKNKT